MKYTLKITLTLFILSLFTATVFAQKNLTADQIADKTYNAYKCFGDDRITTAKMDIKDKNQKTIMNREILVVRKNVKNSSKQKWYAYFKKPADIRKMVFMVWKNPKKDDDRWLYLPSMDLVKRLAGSDKRSSFAGSQFVYEDITGRYPNLDKHELVKTDDKYYEVKSTPIKTSGVEFSYYYTWVDKKTFLPTKRIFYDKKGEKQREYRVEKTKVIQDFPTITQFSMTNLQTGESTYTTYSDLKYNVGIPDNLFTEAYLRRSPRKWLKYNKK